MPLETAFHLLFFQNLRLGGGQNVTSRRIIYPCGEQH